MRCDQCNAADLIPARFTYERMAPDGLRLAMHVEGFECPNCQVRLIVGRDAEQISREWYRLAEDATAVAGNVAQTPTGSWVMTGLTVPVETPE